MDISVSKCFRMAGVAALAAVSHSLSGGSAYRKKKKNTYRSTYSKWSLVLLVVLLLGQCQDQLRAVVLVALDSQLDSLSISQ